MSEVNGPGKEPSKQRQFMREKIVKQPMSKRQVVKRAVAFFFAAIIFGVVSAVSFVVSKPFAERFLGEESTTESTPITIPKDEETTPPPPTSPPETEETEPIEDMLQTAMETYQFSADDLVSIYGNLRALCQDADKSIVVVHSVKREMDWFDNPVENTGLYAGIIVAATKEQLLILTPEDAVEEADSIKVTFSDASEVAGTIKQTDKVAGMAIVSVNTSELDVEKLKEIKPIELGNSYSVKQGDPVIAVGGPGGAVHSTSYGFISYINRNAQVADGVTRILYTDIACSAETGTFLINISGQVIGWVADGYKSESNEAVTAVMAISDYKGILEKLTNGVPAAYFGVIGQEVTETMEISGLPRGVYVVSSIVDGPAYNVGIQNGDIITKIDDKDITSMKEFQAQIESLTPEQPVSAVVRRGSRDAYTELEFEVPIGAR